jgi:hypothetical protein
MSHCNFTKYKAIRTMDQNYKAQSWFKMEVLQKYSELVKQSIPLYFATSSPS